MKSLALTAFLFLASFVYGESRFFRPIGWDLGTEFPATPIQSENRIPKPEGDIVESSAICEFPTELLGLTRIQNPVPISKERMAAAYDGAKNGMLRKTRGRLISEEKMLILGHDSRRYVCEFNNGAAICEQRMLIIGDTLYIFMYMRSKDKKDSDAAKAFFAKISTEEGR